MRSGHKFLGAHGFTGSTGKEHRPHIPGFKHGGEAWMEGAKEHYGKKKHKDHDGEIHNGGVHYDKHGFQHHARGGMVKKGGNLGQYDGCSD